MLASPPLIPAQLKLLKEYASANGFAVGAGIC